MGESRPPTCAHRQGSWESRPFLLLLWEIGCTSLRDAEGGGSSHRRKTLILTSQTPQGPLQGVEIEGLRSFFKKSGGGGKDRLSTKGTAKPKDIFFFSSFFLFFWARLRGLIAVS